MISIDFEQFLKRKLLCRVQVILLSSLGLLQKWKSFENGYLALFRISVVV